MSNELEALNTRTSSFQKTVDEFEVNLKKIRNVIDEIITAGYDAKRLIAFAEHCDFQAIVDYLSGKREDIDFLDLFDLNITRHDFAHRKKDFDINESFKPKEKAALTSSNPKTGSEE